jgi:uncharacterized protein (TIRG00374 family)
LIAARIRFWLRVILSGALIALLLRQVNWGGLVAVLSQIKIGLALTASGLTLLLIALLAVRWQIFLRQQAMALPFQTTLGLTWAGQFFNSVLPGSTGGDVVKIYQLCRVFPERKAAAAVTVIIDRVSALLALGVLAGLALVYGPTFKFSQAGLSLRFSWMWTIGAIVGAAVLGLVAWHFLRRGPHWPARLRHLLSVLRTSFRFNGQTLVALALAGAIHLLNFAIFWLFARALGLELSYGQVLLFMPVILSLLLAPVTVNGHGLREVLLYFYFGQMHVSLPGTGIGPAETVMSLSLLGVASELLWALPGGLWYLFVFRTPGQPSGMRDHNPEISKSCKV